MILPSRKYRGSKLYATEVTQARDALDQMRFRPGEGILIYDGAGGRLVSHKETHFLGSPFSDPIAPSSGRAVYYFQRVYATNSSGDNTTATTFNWSTRQPRPNSAAYATNLAELHLPVWLRGQLTNFYDQDFLVTQIDAVEDRQSPPVVKYVFNMRRLFFEVYTAFDGGLRTFQERPEDCWEYTDSGVGRGITIDTSGNIYTACERGSSIPTVYKFNSAGALQWTYDTGADAYGVAVDSADNVYVVGQRNDNDYEGDNGDEDDRSFWKLDSTGTLVWAADPGSTSHYAVALDSNGVPHIAGAQGGDDKNVRKWTTAGAETWAADVGDTAYAIAVDSIGDILTGSDNGTNNFRKFNSAGAEQFAVDYGTTVYGIAISDAEDAYYLAIKNTTASDNAFKTDTSGVETWGVVISGGTPTNPPRSVAIDRSGNVVVGGRTGQQAVARLDNVTGDIIDVMDLLNNSTAYAVACKPLLGAR